MVGRSPLPFSFHNNGKSFGKGVGEGEVLWPVIRALGY